VRAVIDTNVLVSGLFWTGKPHTLIEQIRAGALTLVSSPALLAELTEVATPPKFKDILARSKTDPELMLTQVRLVAEIVDPPPLCRNRSAATPTMSRARSRSRCRSPARPHHHR